MPRPWIAFAGAGMLLTACASDPHTAKTALGGAAIGAVAGAAIGNNVGDGDAATGALIGAGVGAAAGAAKGCSDQGGCGSIVQGRRQYYDERLRRYYYYESATGRYYWEDGSPRD